ncbi:MAG TPA: amino acid permease [Gammaproteobacteria bacterium]|nr:amino acid permease [Gammaproteobacteria bacterium]
MVTPSPPPAAPASVAPHRRLGVWHAVSVCVGMVIGAGIFKSAPLAAENIPSDFALLAAWAFGGAMSLAGALCFAELAGAFPDPGGDYFFLRKAYGDGAGFLFAWSRFAVIHTGSMAMLAFSFGDYLAEIVDLGVNGSALIGATTIVALAALNLAGLRFGIGMQTLLVVAVIAGLLLVGAAGVRADAPPASPAAAHGPLQIGAGLVYVFLAYGGWSDTATLSAEMRDGDHGIRRALVIGMSLVTGLYLLANWAYVRGLSIDGLAASGAPAADLALLAFGKPGQLAIVAVVAVTSITSMNAILIAGSRTTFAAARDTASLDVLRRWHLDRGTPSRAIVAITLVSLALLAFGAFTRDGFATMVDYLSPVYWLFLTLSGAALIVLRLREPGARRPFRVPGYPVVPLVFIASSVYVFWSSVAYVKVGAVVGVAVLTAGGLLLAALRRSARRK